MKESKSYANYTIIAFLLFYALIQFISTLFIGIPKSLAVYLSFMSAILSFLYFSKIKLILEWVLGIIAPSIIFFAVIIIVSVYLSDYKDSYSIIRISNILFMWIFPMLAFFNIFSYFHSWNIEISQKQIYDSFMKLSYIVYKITAYIYALIYIFCIGISLFSSNIYSTYSDVILIYSPLFTYFLLPLPLTIHAHINKRHIEALFHLGYMIFAPIVFLFALLYKPISFFILCIPLLFVLKNCYLWYRRYTKERKNLRENEG